MSQTALSRHFETLTDHRDRLDLVHMRELFDADKNRFSDMTIDLGELVFDYSKNRIDRPALSELLLVAKASDLEATRSAMFSGKAINTSENRAVLHTALRNRSGNPVFVDGEDVMPAILQVLEDMGEFSDSVGNGTYSPGGKKITDVVNIGIGGSDLGPVMAATALLPYHHGPNVHFVSNVDGADIADTLKGLNPKTTLFIVASKTFTTIETMTNARSAQAWVEATVGASFGDHFCALSTNLEATRVFGISDERTFGFWDWVGGRYSVWSAIGLSMMIAIGKESFAEFLEGGYAADKHFADAELSENIPVIMALLGVWYRNVWGHATHAVLPYDNRLSRFPAYLQQLDMESNGKAVKKDGTPVTLDTGPIVWGEPGTNGQHAFYQLIHQGTDVIPCDFLMAAQAHEDAELAEHHKLLVSNCIAQSEALMIGKTAEQAANELEAQGLTQSEIDVLAPQKAFTGNRPSNTFIYKKLTPKTLGILVALYEHKVFVQGVIWGINSFDQWGVELGKVLAKNITAILDGDASADEKDASTQGLIDAYLKLK